MFCSQRPQQFRNIHRSRRTRADAINIDGLCHSQRNRHKRSILDDHAVDNAERPRLGERGYEPGWNTRFEKEAYRGKLYGSVSRDYPKQDVSLFRTKGVQEDTHEFLSGTRKHHRIEATLPTLQRRIHVVPLPSGCEEFSRKGPREHFVKLTRKIRGTAQKER